MIKEVSNGKHICMNCAHDVYEEIGEYLEVMEERLVKQYNIVWEQEGPLRVCNCICNEVIPFEYYTVPYGDRYMLILSTVCRGCGGYKEIPIHRETFTIHLRDPQECAGLSLDVIGKEKPLDYYR